MDIRFGMPLKLDGSGRYEMGSWSEGWPVPRVGEEVEVEGETLHVRHVIYMPQGDDGDTTPFIYVVLAPIR